MANACSLLPEMDTARLSSSIKFFPSLIPNNPPSNSNLLPPHINILILTPTHRSQAAEQQGKDMLRCTSHPRQRPENVVLPSQVPIRCILQHLYRLLLLLPLFRLFRKRPQALPFPIQVRKEYRDQCRQRLCPLLVEMTVARALRGQRKSEESS